MPTDQRKCTHRRFPFKSFVVIDIGVIVGGKTHHTVTNYCSIMALKLSYFGMGGRALAPRLAFAIGDIPYEDERVDFGEWGTASADRARFPLGALPVLKVGDRVFTQSLAISMYAGDIAGIGPKDALDRLAVTQAVLTIEEIYTGENGFSATLHMEDGDAKVEARKRFLETNLLFHLARLEKLLEESGTGYFGQSLSVADLTLLGVHGHFTGGDVDHVPTTCFDAFPKLVELRNKVAALPAVQAHFAKHPYG